MANLPLDEQPINAVISTRISLDRETQSSIANQLRECRELCNTREINVVGEFSDVGKSAFDLNVERPGFDAAMAMIESGKANTLIVWKLDRMSRNAIGFMRIHDRLQAANAKFLSVKEPWFDTSNPIGLVLVMLMSAMAQTESENISLRLKSWHEGRRIEGHVPLGNRPYGYRRPKREDADWQKGGALIVNPDEQGIILEIAERVLGGDGLGAIARDLNARGIPAPSGNGNEWSHSAIRKILLSPTVAGCFPDGKSATSWDAIINTETASQLRDTLSDPLRDSRYGAQRIPHHLLTNIMRCGREGCGGEMNTYIGGKGNRRYRCKGCKMSINAEVPETIVDEWIAHHVTDSKWRRLRSSGKGLDLDLIVQLESDIDELSTDYYSRKGKPGAMSKPTYDELLGDMTAALDAAMTGDRIKLPDIESLAGWDAMTIADRRLVVNATIESITVGERSQEGRTTIEGARNRVSVVAR